MMRLWNSWNNSAYGLNMEIPKRELSREEIIKCSKIVATNHNKLPYQSYGRGQYEIYCPFCQTYKRISAKELKIIQNAKQCPTCFERFASTTRDNVKIFEDYVKIDKFGYRIKAKWEFGKPIETLETDQCIYFEDEDKTYVKDLYLADFARKIRRQTDEDYISHSYRKSSSRYWECNCYAYPREQYPLWLGAPNLIRKIALEKEIKTPLKSTQKKMVIESTFFKIQVDFMKVFDLNDAELVFKYSEYMNKNKDHIYEFIHDNIQLNKYYLDYLSRNNIDLGKYYHFITDLSALGFKYEKPTDFKHRYETVQQIVKEKKDEMNDLRIKQRYERLPKYKKGKITISPFKTAQEIVNCGKALHNCIGGYVERYANGKTNIFHLDVENKLTLAIEVHNNTLSQAYADLNKKASPNLMKHVKKWCEDNGIDLGYYK